MTPEQHQRVRDLFDEVFELPAPAQASWLAEACPDDAEVRAAVEQILREQAAHPTFLETQSASEMLGLPSVSLPQFTPGLQLGPFRLVRELGQGGGGTVFLAERIDGAFTQQVAIKLVWPGSDSDALRRFQQEREILARLAHPHIARLLDGGATAEGWHYLVMEYVEGEPITTYCQTQQLTLPARLTLFRAVCAAVQFAHQNLVIHRDIKPSNLMVTRDGTPKLLDFGIAKLLERDPQAGTLTGTGMQPFTPLYASPEQIRNEPITTASDVYSLGVLLYELLTGVRPYGANATTHTAQMRAVCEDDPPRPSAAVAERLKDEGGSMKDAPLSLPPSALRGDLDNIVLKALRKEAAQRYSTVEQLSDDLQRHLNGEPVTARPATWRYQASKYVGRNKPLVAAASTLLLALIVGALVTFWQLRASQAREHTQRYELYAADLRQASADWSEGNLVSMDELLERHRPGNGADDEWRGFEWFALWKLLHTEKFNLHHQASTPTVAFTPDGKALLTGTQERIEKWDAQTGQTLGRFATYPHGATGLSFFKTKTHLVVNNTRSRFGIWDYATQQQILEVAFKPSDSYGSLFTTLSPDETQLVTSSYGQPFQIWDTSTGQQLGSFSVPAEIGVPPPGPAIYTPDGKLLCLLIRDRYFELWDLKARRPAAQLDPDSTDPNALQLSGDVSHLFSLDGTRYYLPTKDFLIRVWDYPHGGKPRQVLTGHKQLVETPALSPDGRLLASGSNDRTLRLWDTQTGKLLVTVVNESQTFSLVFSPDGKSLAAVCMRALRTKVWDVQSLLASNQTLEGVQTFGLSPQGKLLTYTPNAGLSLTDLQTSQRLRSFTNAPFATCHSYDCARLSADGKMFAFVKKNLPTQPGLAEVRESANGKSLAILKGHTGPLGAVAFSPDGQKLATTGVIGQIKVWETATGRELSTLQGKEGQIALDFSPDGSKLVSCGLDSMGEVWDLTSGKALFNLGNRSSWMLKARFSPDGKLIATSDMNFTIKLWDATTGLLRNSLKGHANSVYAFAFSPDGKRLASGSDDKTVRLWDLQTGTELAALRGHTSAVSQVFFTPDSQTLISSGEDGTRIWRTATEAEVRSRYK